MIRSYLFLTAASLSVSAPAIDVQPEPAAVSSRAFNPLAIDWTVSPTSRSDQVQLRLSYRTREGNSDNSRSYPIAQLQGLDANASGPVTFRLGGEAGSLDCSGTMRDVRGAGTCRFQPDARFAGELERRGIGRATTEQMYHMAIGGVQLALADELARLGYDRPTVDNMVEAGIFGIDVPYVREMGTAATGSDRCAAWSSSRFTG